jgi:hypothetical protein
MDNLPLDVLKIVLFFIETIPDSLTALLVCRQWYTLLKGSSLHWKQLGLQFWNEYKKLLSRDGVFQKIYNVEVAQSYSKKDWIW